MIRSLCQSRGCKKVTRARVIHKYCREHHLTIEGIRRGPNYKKKTKVIKTKPVKIEAATPKGKKKK